MKRQAGRKTKALSGIKKEFIKQNLKKRTKRNKKITNIPTAETYFPEMVCKKLPLFGGLANLGTLK